MALDEAFETAASGYSEAVTEFHIVGGLHPDLPFQYFLDLVSGLKERFPQVHLKAFTMVEVAYLAKRAKFSIADTLARLKAAGVDSLPGGGAEIFDEEVREKICADKVDSEGWLAIHEAIHNAGMHSNATMLYGHIEKYEHRIDHMDRLRKLQDKTGGFNTFIPLKFRNKQNDMSNVSESGVIEDMRMYAIARLYMDNFPHLKAYWPMLGRHNAQLTLSFGVNDIDGTIDDSTKIYSMAGSEEQNPAMSTAQLVTLIKQAKRKPVERDTLYNVLHDYSDMNVDQMDVNPQMN
jgi:aminodeoxyfutalosine synthase